MATPVPDDAGLFQWIIGGIAAAGAGALLFLARSLGGRIEAVETRANSRIDAVALRVETIRDDARADSVSGDEKLWTAVDAIRAGGDARHHEILTTMATKDDLRELGRDLGQRIEAAITRAMKS